MATVKLKEIERASAANFFEKDGRYYATIQGQTYAVADQVECYKDGTDSWFDQEDGRERLNACLAFSGDLTLYIDPVGNKVRIIIAN